MSEGTPGRGPDADSRTDNGEGQAPTNGRPAVPPVRYGPRNGSPSNGANGRGARTVPGPNAPQQYRAPQPPRPANGTTGPAPSGTGTNGNQPNGNQPNGNQSSGTQPNSNQSNGTATNGNGSTGAHAVTPGSYTRPQPRTNGAPARPEPSEQERLVTDARTAAAARNASAARVRGGSALSGNRPAPAARQPEAAATNASAAAPVDETAVIPAVTSEPSVVTPAGTSSPDTTTQETATPEKGRSIFGRRRDRRPAGETQAPEAAAVQPPVEPTTVATASAGAAAATVESTPAEAPVAEEPETPTELVSAVAQEESAGTEERPLTWRDRLGLPPKESKTQPVVAPEARTEPSEPSTEPAEPKTEAAAVASPAQPQDRVTPSAPTPATTTDTVIIPAVDAGGVSAAAPAAATAVATTAQPLAAPKAKVGAARRTRKARLRLSRVDPWSVMKTALLFSIAAGIILVVATYGVWSVLNASGLFDAVNDMVKSVVSTPGDTTPFRIEEYVNTQKIIGVAALIAVVDVLIFTALATLGSFLYNLAATVLGGLEVTLAED